MRNEDKMSFSTVSGADDLTSKQSRQFSGFMKKSLCVSLLEATDCIERKPCIVLMPLDESRHSDYCIHYYIEFIHKPENQVHVCYVANDYLRRKRSSEALPESSEARYKPSMCDCLKRKFKRIDLGPSPGVLAELEQKDRAQCHVVKYKVKEMFTTNRIQYEFHRLTGDDPWTAILNFKDEINASLIVMGSRGQGTLRRSIFGSVSDRILKNSNVPVLVVKQTTPHCSSIVYHGVPESLIH